MLIDESVEVNSGDVLFYSRKNVKVVIFVFIGELFIVSLFLVL